MTYFSGLHTDRYELTMLDAALRSGMADRRSVFEVFTRSLAGGRRYGVVAGLGRLVEIIGSFAFDDADLRELEQEGVVSSSCLSYLADYRFHGNIDAYAEGEIYFPFSPVLTVEASFAEALVLETVILSVLNHDSAVASAASRMVQAAKGRSIIEMGSRRTHEEAAISAARAAYLAGFASTSNLEAARRYGIPSAGTVAHAFILAYPDEASAFKAQIATQGTGTTLLVDTFDIPRGIRSAVDVAGTDLGAIRIDSGDLLEESWKARALLDDLGATKTKM
jgi:putative nicotinate phosphoribosyltransferase